MSDMPPAYPHGALREVFSDVFFVTGTVKMPGPMRFSRNMVVVRDGAHLVLINSIRLSEAGLAELEKLGAVTDVVRIAGYHGADDPFYKQRYGATVSVVSGQTYRRGFDYSGSQPTYFEPDAQLSATSSLPIAGAKLYVFGTTPPEGALLLDREGGILVTGDSLQNWATTDEYFSFAGKLMMRAMGFIKPHNVGPAWFKSTKPKPAELRGVLDLPFEHLLPAHGQPVRGDARAKYRAAVERVTR